MAESGPPIGEPEDLESYRVTSTYVPRGSKKPGVAPGQAPPREPDRIDVLISWWKHLRVWKKIAVVVVAVNLIGDAWVGMTQLATAPPPASSLSGDGAQSRAEQCMATTTPPFTGKVTAIEDLQARLNEWAVQCGASREYEYSVENEQHSYNMAMDCALVAGGLGGDDVSSSERAFCTKLVFGGP
jgi:hypothetical protein